MIRSGRGDLADVAGVIEQEEQEEKRENERRQSGGVSDRLGTDVVAQDMEEDGLEVGLNEDPGEDGKGAHVVAADETASSGMYCTGALGFHQLALQKYLLHCAQQAEGGLRGMCIRVFPLQQPVQNSMMHVLPCGMGRYPSLHASQRLSLCAQISLASRETSTTGTSTIVLSYRNICVISMCSISVCIDCIIIILFCYCVGLGSCYSLSGLALAQYNTGSARYENIEYASAPLVRIK